MVTALDIAWLAGWLGALGVLLVGLLAGAAYGNPPCGAALHANTVLDSDLNCGGMTSGNALSLDSGVTLDCQWHTITGPNTVGGLDLDVVGIRISTRSNVTVLNCHATKFRRGLWISDSSNVVVYGVQPYSAWFGNTSYGIALTGSSSGNTFHGVSADTNGDEGMHLSGPFPFGATAPNTILNSRFCCNARESLYFFHANDVRLVGSRAGAGGNADNQPHAAVYVKHSSGLNALGLYVVGGFVQVIGASYFNHLGPLRIENGFLKLQNQLGEASDPLVVPGWNYVPGDNTFTGLCISPPAGVAAIQLSGLTANNGNLAFNECQ